MLISDLVIKTDCYYILVICIFIGSSTSQSGGKFCLPL